MGSPGQTRAARQGEARQGKARQDKAGQGRTRQDQAQGARNWPRDDKARWLASYALHSAHYLARIPWNEGPG